MLEKAPRRRAAERLLAKLPDELDCKAEQRLPQVIDGWRGRIDLEFTGADGFQVLVEAKIYALYEPGQVQGYLDSSSCYGLVGIVRNRFEQAEPEDERWLGRSAGPMSSRVGRTSSTPIPLSPRYGGSYWKL